MVHITINNISKLRIGSGPVCLLDISVIQANWLELWLMQPAGIRTRKFLLPEIWKIVLDFVLDERERETVAVIPQAISREAKSFKVLECVEIKVDEYHLEYIYDVEHFEKFLKDPTAPQDVSETTLEDPCKLGSLDHPRTFHVLIPSESGSTSKRNSGLKAGIGVPECIAFLWGQNCWVCEKERNICPGCGGGVAGKFEAAMGCFVSLACPMCLGVEFCLDDRDYLMKYYGEDPPEDEFRARMAKIEARLKSLTYEFRAEEWGE